MKQPSPSASVFAGLSRLLLVAVAALLIPGSSRAAIVYVNQNAPGPAHDGTSWTTAYTTSNARVNAAATNDEIWVAGGTYSEGDITLQAGQRVYGGFAGTETGRNQRDWRAHPTVVDGDPNYNVFVVVVLGVTIDGFTIQRGNCGFCYYSGGAAAVNNDTLSDGGYGVYCYVATATVTNSIQVFGSKGVARDSSASAITLTQNDVYGNTANFTNSTDPKGTNGNISQDPLFPARAAGDFHLSFGSRCIDSGDDSALSSGETDLDGNPRKLGAHVDMGGIPVQDGAEFPPRRCAQRDAQRGRVGRGFVRRGGAPERAGWGSGQSAGRGPACAEGSGAGGKPIDDSRRNRAVVRL